MLHRRSALAAMAAFLTGCAQAPTQRLATCSQPVHAVRVFTWSAGDPALTGSPREAFAATLRRNGMTVSQFTALPRPLVDLKALERLWSEAPAGSPGTHALVLTRQYEQRANGTRYIRYEAVLWDARTLQLVWLGKLSSVSAHEQAPLDPIPGDAVQRAERLAADVLRGLDRENLFALNGQPPLDGRGAAIAPTLIPLELR